MNIIFPPKVRFAIYLVIVMGTATIVPMNQYDIVNDAVLAVWTSISGAAAMLAALNVSNITGRK